MASMPVLLLQLQLLLGTAAVASAITWSPSCPATCGNISIPYPFGIGPNCFMEGFEVTCNDSKPFLGGNVELIDVDLPQGIAHVYGNISWNCNYQNKSAHWPMNFKGTSFKFSDTRNKFTAVGCDAYAYMVSSDAQGFVSGCMLTCFNISSTIGSSCNGLGCCQASIPKGIVQYDSIIFVSNPDPSTFQLYPCIYSFLADEKWHKLMASDIRSSDFYERNKNGVPLALDWAVGGTSCEKAKLNPTSYLCRSEYSECTDSPNGPGYYCNCSVGYEGNPYLSNGCQDIDECARREQYPCYGACRNSPGSYTCYCPHGTHGNALIKAGQSATAAEL